MWTKPRSANYLVLRDLGPGVLSRSGVTRLREAGGVQGVRQLQGGTEYCEEEKVTSSQLKKMQDEEH